MYFVKYGKEYLHNPLVEGYMLLDLSLDSEENSCGYCDFTIYPDHPLYDKLKERDAENPIKVYDDDILLFAGFIYEIGKEFYLDGHVKCKGELDYLSESIVRPYATYTRGFGTTAPNTLGEYFEWLIEQHNNQVEKNRQFTVGINQAYKFNLEEELYISNDSYPTTIEEISSVLIGTDGYGGYLNVRHEGDVRYIDYIYEWDSKNTQILDFGKNLTNYTQTDDSVDLATFVVPIGPRISETECTYNDGYFVTSDTRVQTDKEYYTVSYEYYGYSELSMFYNGVVYYERTDRYVSTQDTYPMTNKTYYGPGGSPVYTNLDEFEEGVIYFEYDPIYYVTSDTAPVSGKTYFTRFASYSQCSNLTEFETGTTYYEYNAENDESEQLLTISGIEDSVYYKDDFKKEGDLIYSKSAVNKYGWIGCTYSNSELTTREVLLYYAAYYLESLISTFRTIEVKAVDMHLINRNIKPIRIGEYVRVRSAPHKLDGYFLCHSIDLDLSSPENSLYTLTTTYSKDVGETSDVLKQLNSTIYPGIDEVESIHTESASPTSTSYVTFRSTSAFSLSRYTNEITWDGTLEYSTNQTTWSVWDGSSISAALRSGEYYIYMRGTGNTNISYGHSDSRWVLTGSNIQCIGNIESLLDYETVDRGGHPEMAAYCYSYMFYNCTNLIKAPSLPATTLSDHCYYAMFRNCSHLVSAPTLPATTLVQYCYQSMFANCRLLVNAPVLPATALAKYCYSAMFDGCNSLKKAPALPATTLANYCYQAMFRNCIGMKVSDTQTGSYQYKLRVPTTGTGTSATGWNTDMFLGTTGTFTSDPSIDTTYYLDITSA